MNRRQQRADRLRATATRDHVRLLAGAPGVASWRLELVERVARWLGVPTEPVILHAGDDASAIAERRA